MKNKDGEDVVHSSKEITTRDYRDYLALNEIDPKNALKRFYKFVKEVADGPYNMNVHDVMELSWEDLIGIIDLDKDQTENASLDLADIFGEMEA